MLSEFRSRLVAGDLTCLALDALLERLAGLGLVKAGGRQRTDSNAPRGALLYPQPSWEELEGRFLDLMAYPDSKDERDSSLPENQRSCSGV